MRIENNPIELRIATPDEEREARMLFPESWPSAEYVLVSDVAFPRQRSYYRGCVEGNVIVLGGWMGKV